MTFDDGIARIYDMVDVSEPGMKPVFKLRLKTDPYFGFETVGITRYYTALQAHEQITDVIHIWEDRTITTNNICILEDGKQYKCTFVQHTINEDNMPITKISIERITEEYELE